MAQQNGTVDVQHKNTRRTVQKHCTRIHTFKYNKKKEHKSMIEKKYILNKPKVLYFLHIHLTSVTTFSQNIYF